MFTITVTKIETKDGVNRNNEPWKMHTIYGKKDDGKDFKSSCFSPIGDWVKEGEKVSVAVEKKGQYWNISDIKPLNAPAPATTAPKTNGNGKEPDWDKIRAEKTDSILVQVALKEATLDMAQILNLPRVLDAMANGTYSVAEYFKIKHEAMKINLEAMKEALKGEK